MTHNTANQKLGATALWTASARAQESEREDRLFNDPWAAALAGPEGKAWRAQQAGGAFNTAPMVIRTRFFDDFLMHTAIEQGIRQIVILATGLDTRAFRIAWPAGTRLFELDQPEVLAYKDQVLASAGAQAACERQAIAADLTESWKEALIGRSFDPGQPSGWLVEGLLFYLENEAITGIIDAISGLSAPGSWLGFDIVNSMTLTSPITRGWIEMQAKMGAPWIGSMDDPEEFLSARGWQASLTQPGAADANFGRWTLPVIPVNMPNMPHQWYVTAQKVKMA